MVEAKTRTAEAAGPEGEERQRLVGLLVTLVHDWCGVAVNSGQYDKCGCCKWTQLRYKRHVI